MNHRIVCRLAGGQRVRKQQSFMKCVFNSISPSRFASAIAGKGGMPAKGTCMDCSDNDIKVTVQYMLDSLE